MIGAMSDGCWSGLGMAELLCQYQSSNGDCPTPAEAVSAVVG